MDKEEIIKGKFETYSEGNKYLYDVLCSCYENEIETYAYCAGNNANKPPYFAIIIKKEYFNVIRNIIANLQDMKDISMEYTARFDANNEVLKKGKCRGFIIRGALNNRCEMFYRINEGINHQQKFPKTSLDAEMFFRKMEKFYEMDEEEIQTIKESGRIVSGLYSNNSDELLEYNKLVRKLNQNSIITKFSQTFTKNGKKEKERFQKLDKIYGILQNEYVPSLKETIKEPADYDQGIESREEENEYEDAEYYELNKRNTDENEK